MSYEKPIHPAFPNKIEIGLVRRSIWGHGNVFQLTLSEKSGTIPLRETS